jgi:hypothetical protein
VQRQSLRHKRESNEQGDNAAPIAYIKKETERETTRSEAIMGTQPSLGEVETEVVVLLAIYELIDSIVHKGILDVFEGAETSEVRFKDGVCARYFNLVLTDMLSLTDKDGPVIQRSYIGALTEICQHPSFDVGDSILPLRGAAQTFRSWLQETIIVPKMWLPTLSLEIDLRICRIELLKIAGNICKHNVLRSVQTMRAFQKALADSGATLDLNQVLLATNEAYDWLHTHKFVAQSNAIVEFLNNIRWGICDYLAPEYARSKVNHPDGVGYSYTYPAEITDDFARASYWDLMNKLRSQPYLPRFRVRQFWKGEVDKY